MTTYHAVFYKTIFLIFLPSHIFLFFRIRSAMVDRETEVAKVTKEFVT